MDLRSFFTAADKRAMVSPENALPSRATAPFTVPDRNVVLGTRMDGPWDEGVEVIYLAMGCFWGAEEYYWQLPGVVSTAVGYMGGYSAHPTYEEVCTGRTGHTETALVAYDTARVSTLDVLRLFWEHHDPTQGYRQGNDVGTQYRSAIFWTTDDQRELAEKTRDAYQEVLTAKGIGEITTEIAPAAEHTFYYAEDYHQQYLHKVPHGYRCHANTGVPLPL
ncbi:MAG: peptide-methionine (S)-S-oxide reductase MsrA [Candidatus Nanopelagicales bacterium]